MVALSRPASTAMLILTVALTGCGGFRSGEPARPRVAAPIRKAPAPGGSNNLIGKLDGGIIGQKIGSQLSPSDRRLALEAEYHALEEAPGGKAITWQSPANPVSGSVVAAPPYQVGSQNCRQYTHTVTIDGAEKMARGAACRNADGSWTPLT